MYILQLLLSASNTFLTTAPDWTVSSKTGLYITSIWLRHYSDFGPEAKKSWWTLVYIQFNHTLLSDDLYIK